ncbi:MAG: PadR family transcriptional regulator, partial [Anaerolineae bacterium]|nr:PadR family transcriptional regulator [Anaerolineae bacterium]
MNNPMSPMTSTPLTIEWSLLGVLHKQPMHGYEIYQTLSNFEGIGLVWRLKQSQVYALLSKLEERGYVTATLEPQDPRPPRKVYELTANGHQALMEWIQSPVEHGRDVRLEFLAKLYFAQKEGKEYVQTLLNQQQMACEEWIIEYQMQAATIEQEQPYEWLVYQFRIGQMQAMVEWLT